ncbi:SMP-30/gluconolactonase/LRE family protein [Rhodococcus opacus]|uniref:SMP-30/gluconolactonase/LRE family protein n=1 Tax=Rhodococcus opacus TaxID=37919 RepID=UPI000EAA284F|nr:SMP-30/gluconolactonase/LRE family protein [Rhodococcus opacus]QZS59128.1 SMP-30/gluconolactonase/LRE family protein [Rhodococcus opacus]RKM74291.1 gluconolactonase [Rhodococcus opacus]WKN55369.1 SMP-30/gluconolactonase/LRE family protein [Rhodococcus opacus]
MTEYTLRTIVDGYSYLEGPRWHEGRLWFADFYTHTVNAVNADGSIELVATVPHQPSGLGWLPDGRLLIVSMKDRKVLRQESDGTLVEHADIRDLCGGHANDMVVDAQGRAYVGNFGFDLMGGAPHEHTTVVLVDTDGSASIVADGLSFPNGMVITPDGSTLLVNELFGNRISAFDIHPDGTLGERIEWAGYGDLGAEPDVGTRLEAATIVPDGLTLDAEGAVWIADAGNNRAVRIAKGGEILDEVSTAPDGVFAVALGGDDGRTLFLCVAPNFDETERTATRLGRMLATEVDVPHAGRP